MYKQYLEGATLEEVDADHGGITRERVRQLFNKAGLDRRRPGSGRTRQAGTRALRVEAVPTRPAPKRYSDQELIDFLRKAAHGHDGPLTLARYGKLARRWGRRWPTADTYRARFGSWRRALETAGVPVRSPQARRGPFIDRDECVAAVRRVVHTLGKLPTGEEYERFARKSGESMPSLETVKNRCEGWRQALRMAGD